MISKTKVIELGTDELTIDDVVGVARYGWEVKKVGPDAKNPNAQKAFQRLLESRTWVENATKGSGKLLTYYGINTGFGPKAGSEGLSREDIPWVSRNLIVSHSTGVGNPLHPEIVRAAMMIRANSLSIGYSGVRPEVVNTLVEMLNKGVVPQIPEYGSVGASGDLAPLSHLGLVLSKRPSDGEKLGNLPNDYEEGGKAYVYISEKDDIAEFEEVVKIDGVKYGLLNGHRAMEIRGIELLELGAKEGLAFNNGATFSAAIAALAVYDAENITRNAEIAAAISLESLLGFRDAFLERLQTIRKQQGQIGTASRIRKIINGSNLVDGDEDTNPRVIPPQDPYSLRVTPQVIGAVWDALGYIRQIVSNELNAATDNPFIFLDMPRDYKTASGGNFHGAPIGYVMDFLGIVMTDLGSLSERRTFRLTDDNLNHKLPSMLIADEPDKPGRTSGMMITQYLAAGLVSECKTLAHPDSVDSIPTSANQEDHVSMSMNAARHARQIVWNIGAVISVELLCGSIALNLRKDYLINKSEDQEHLKNQRISKWIEHFSNKTQPKAGIGTEKAFQVIEDALYGKNPLPELGKRQTAEDRFMQPYVRRMQSLVRDGTLVSEVYAVAGI